MIDFETLESSVDRKVLRDRVIRYAGKSMGNPRKPTNPNLTTREIIVLADYISALEDLCNSDSAEDK